LQDCPREFNTGVFLRFSLPCHVFSDVLLPLDLFLLLGFCLIFFFVQSSAPILFDYVLESLWSFWSFLRLLPLLFSPSIVCVFWFTLRPTPFDLSPVSSLFPYCSHFYGQFFWVASLPLIAPSVSIFSSSYPPHSPPLSSHFCPPPPFFVCLNLNNCLYQVLFLSKFNSRSRDYPFPFLCLLCSLVLFQVCSSPIIGQKLSLKPPLPLGSFPVLLPRFKSASPPSLLFFFPMLWEGILEFSHFLAPFSPFLYVVAGSLSRSWFYLFSLADCVEPGLFLFPSSGVALIRAPLYVSFFFDLTKALQLVLF